MLLMQRMPVKADGKVAFVVERTVGRFVEAAKHATAVDVAGSWASLPERLPQSESGGLPLSYLVGHADEQGQCLACPLEILQIDPLRD